jgi:bleomycin hydrolase
MGEPPAEFDVDGQKYTPKEYLKNYLQINPDDYVDILSYMQQPYYQQVEYEVPDNWWHNKDYFNVPLDEFMSALKKAIRDGYTMAIGGDVSEPGYVAQYDVAIVPDFDIPSQLIDENARQLRFSNKSTTDDHGIHLVGYMTKNGKDWYLIKDSGSGSRDGNNKGFYFYSEDYVKLKIMDFMVHKDAVKDLLAK